MRILLTNDDGVNAPGLKVLEAIARTISAWVAAAGAGGGVCARAGRARAARKAAVAVLVAAAAIRRRVENAEVMESVLSRDVNWSTATTVAAVGVSVRRPCIAPVRALEGCVKL